MASQSVQECDPRSLKSNHEKCVDCEKWLGNKNNKKIYSLKGESNKRLREFLGEDKEHFIFDTDLLCNSCYQKLHKRLKALPTTTILVSNEEEDVKDETLLKIKCVKGTQHKCFVCGQETRYRVTDGIRISIYELFRLYVPKTFRICSEHLTADKLNKNLYSKIEYHGYETLEGQEVNHFLELRASLNERNEKFSFTHKEDYPIFTGLTEEKFNDIHQKYLFGIYNAKNRSSHKALGIYLTKLKTGMSHKEIATIFRLSENCVQKTIREVRKRLVEKLVGSQFDIKSLKRTKLLSHMSPLVKHLHCKGEEVVTMLDGTYSFIQKSDDNQFQRKTFSVQKGRHLIKPMIWISADGYIIGIFGPFQANKNDAKIINQIISDNRSEFNRIFESTDVFIVDRGFRDATELTENYRVEMPSCAKGQLSSIEANKTRFVTKVRYKIEVVNGRLKQNKLLSIIRPNTSIETLMDDWRISGALFNQYFEPIESDKDRTEWIASQFKLRLNSECILKENALKMDKKRLIWKKFDHDCVQDFPKLSLEDIYSLTLGSYQIKRCKSYVLEHINSKNIGTYEIEICSDPDYKADIKLIRVKIQSRHKSSKNYNVYIEYDSISSGYASIKGHFCKCNSGCRTVGMCSHITSIMWFLGFVRHESNYLSNYKNLSKFFETEEQEESENEDEL